MRGLVAKKLRHAAGGIEVSDERSYGFVPKTKKQKTRAYTIIDASGKKHGLCPLVCMSEGRRRYKALKKQFRIMAKG